MTPEEAARNLALIREVIDRSRAERARSGDIYLAWGLAVVLADAITTGSVALLDFPWGWVAFPILMPIAMIYAATVSVRRGLQLATFGWRVEGALWGFTLAAQTVFFTAGTATGLLGLRAIVPVISAGVGVAVGTSGTLFASRGMTATGALFVAVCGVSCFLPLTEQHVLFMAAITVGYIAPGLKWVWDERNRASRTPSA